MITFTHEGETYNIEVIGAVVSFDKVEMLYHHDFFSFARVGRIQWDV